MRVVHVIARMNAGGTAQYLDKLVTGLNSFQIESSILTGFVQAGELEDSVTYNLPIIRIPALGRRISIVSDLRARREIKRILNELQPDIIHTHTFKAGFLVRTISTSTPIVHTFHGHLLDDPEFAGFKKRIIIQLERLLARKAVALVTVGKRVTDELLDSKIGKASQYSSIPPGVSPLQQLERNEARKLYNLPKDAVVGVWLARFAPVKNPFRMVEIAKQFPDVIFVMGGTGNLIDEVKYSAPENLHVIGWTKANELLSAGDFLISTSENEGMPVAFIEAQMMGIPVIATDVGSVSEVVLDRETGRVVENSDLAIALNEFLNQPASWSVYADAATSARNRFSVETMISRHIELYKSILNKSG